jgi:glutamine amidotransferase/cyclase
VHHQCGMVHATRADLLVCLPLPVCAQSGKAFFGICLGLQLLFDGSEESGGCEGLGIIPGRVTQFDISKGLPVPHIGWNELSQQRPSTLLQGVGDKRVYFVHSYR